MISPLPEPDRGGFLSNLTRAAESIWGDLKRTIQTPFGQETPNPVGERMMSAFQSGIPALQLPLKDLANATTETAQSWGDIPGQVVNKLQEKPPLPVRQMSPSAQRGLYMIGMGFANPQVNIPQKVKGIEKPFSNLNPEQFTKENIIQSLDKTGGTPMDSMLFHSRKTQYMGDIPETRGGVWFSNTNPVKYGHIYVIDRTKLDSSKVFIDSDTGYVRYAGSIPKKAYLYLGEWKVNTSMTFQLLGEQIKKALLGGT